jgi:penicillin amidase
MKPFNTNTIFSILVLLLWIVVLSNQFSVVPPIGKIVNPFIGAVQNENEIELYTPRHAISGLGFTDTVHVLFDHRKVPHIYASNTNDLYAAQGYVTASLRLWQMDFVAHTSAGRLCEIFSEGFLDYDRNQRRIGILMAAEKALTLIEKDTLMNRILVAYTRGVNAYISRLSYKTMPFEYKLLDYKPEPWTRLKTVLVMKHLANTLSGYDEDFNMTNLMLLLGEDKFNKLFPGLDGQSKPVIGHLQSPANPSLVYSEKPSYLDFQFFSSSTFVPPSTYNPKLGSNSWIVSGKKTRSGYPILASDPHLNLSLPSIWLEMQLSSPQINVYGVSIPGTPSIIIGFNENIAWGLVNGQDDVRDWYKLKITDDYKKYEFDGRWMDLTYRIEEIKIKEKASVLDTVYYSQHGPLVSTKAYSKWSPQHLNHALKWELHNPSNELLAFVKLNEAKNYSEFKNAIKYYSCPIQNFTFASKTNDIAVYHQGNMPVKWPAQGKFILDGTKSAHLYSRYIVEDSLPNQLNPASGLIVAANQAPTSAQYPYYYQGYFSENRANRIHQLLEEETYFDADRMKMLQLDNVNDFAVKALPVLLAPMDSLVNNSEQQKYLKALGVWNGSYDVNDENAKLFELWWKYIKEYTWDEFRNYSAGSKTPADAILLELIRRDRKNPFFDKLGTEENENAVAIIRRSFEHALIDYNTLKKKGKAKWGDNHKTFIWHMTNINTFSRLGLPTSGSSETVNASGGKWGPSWRMIVELGERPRAFGVYAGGQSGNIGSRYFDDSVDDWAKGKYHSLIFYMTQSEANKQSGNKWTLK